MKRVLAGAALAAALTSGGCAAGNESYPDHVDVTGSASVATIEVPRLPDTLPRSVEEASRHVVAIKVGTMVQGSGVRIDSKYVVTAGHLVANNPEDYKLISENCGVLSAIDDGAPHGNSNAFPERLIARYTPPNREDIAGFSLSTIANGFEAVPPLPIGEAVEDGEIVYFVNYQPTVGNGPRMPSSEGPNGQPAIYGGVVLKQANGQASVLTGLKSYGTIEDDFSRRSSSGGPVFNKDGKLVAVLGGGTVRADLDPSNILANVGVEPIGSGVDGDTGLSYSDIQLVNPTYVDALKRSVDSAAPCKF